MTFKEQFLYAIEQRDDLLFLLSMQYPAYLTKAKKGDIALWRDIVMMNLPTGQVSYHIPPEEARRFSHHLCRRPNDWDGHDSEERHRRIMELCRIEEEI